MTYPTKTTTVIFLMKKLGSFWFSTFQLQREIPGLPWSFRFAAAEWWCRFSGPLGWGCITGEMIWFSQTSHDPCLGVRRITEHNHRWKDLRKWPWDFLIVMHSKICCVVAPPEREEKASETQVQLGRSLQGSWNHRPLLWRKTTKAINGKLGPQDAFTAGQREILAASAAQEIQEVQKNLKKPQLPMPSRSFHCPCGSKEPR